MRCILIICFLLTINISNCIWIWSCLNDFIWNKMKVEWVNSDGPLCNDVKDQAKDEPISNMMSLFLQVCLFMSWNSQWQVERSFQNAMCFIIFWYYKFFKELFWLFLRILSHAQVRVLLRCCQEGFQASTETLRCPVFWCTTHCTRYTHSGVHCNLLYTT